MRIYLVTRWENATLELIPVYAYRRLKKAQAVTQILSKELSREYLFEIIEVELR